MAGSSSSERSRIRIRIASGGAQRRRCRRYLRPSARARFSRGRSGLPSTRRSGSPRLVDKSFGLSIRVDAIRVHVEDVVREEPRADGGPPIAGVMAGHRVLYALLLDVELAVVHGEPALL